MTRHRDDASTGLLGFICQTALALKPRVRLPATHNAPGVWFTSSPSLWRGRAERRTPDCVRSLACESGKAHEFSHHGHTGPSGVPHAVRRDGLCARRPRWSLRVTTVRRACAYRRHDLGTLAGHHRSQRPARPHLAQGNCAGTIRAFTVRGRRCRHPGCFSQPGVRTPASRPPHPASRS
jgi:hypothetical protein